MQEEIKITSITVFVNPYSEPDEEEEKAKEEENAEDEDKVCFWVLLNISCLQKLCFSKILADLSLGAFQDKVGSWYSNPGTGATEAGAIGAGGVGKYLKSRNQQIESTADDTGLSAITVAKKRKVGVSTGEFKDFSGW